MNKKRNVLIGGAWPYANSTLHIGHLACLIPGDTLARYHRLKGDNVVYVSGSDCHGTPITMKARKENITPSSICDACHKGFVETFNLLNFSYNLYTQTTTEFHKGVVKDLLKKIYNNGYIYEKEDDVLYCEHCGKIVEDREILYTCKHCGRTAKGDGCDCGEMPTFDDLKSGKCATCGHELVVRKDKNLYFKLSAFQNKLEDYVKANENRWRLNAVNETKKYLKMGLIDRAITRNLDWGVEVPFEGYENKRIYVWFEAVLGYVSACMKYCLDNNLNYNDYLKEGSCDLSYMAHGKDNITFHTIIFPALLMAINENYKLPTDIVSSEYLTLNGDKISKSSGNYEETKDIVERGSSDTLRFFMLGFGPEKKDSDFSNKLYATIHNSEIVNKLGNFVNRTLKFKGLTEIKKDVMNEEVKNTIIKYYDEIGTQIEKYEFKESCKLILSLLEYANKYYDESKPWVLAKENLEEFNRVMYTCSNVIYNLANILNPFMPETSQKITNFFDLDTMAWNYMETNKDLKIKEFEPLFTRMDVK